MIMSSYSSKLSRLLITLNKHKIHFTYYHQKETAAAAIRRQRLQYLSWMTKSTKHFHQPHPMGKGKDKGQRKRVVTEAQPAASQAKKAAKKAAPKKKAAKKAAKPAPSADMK